MYLLLRISLTFWLGVYKGTSGSHSTSRHLPSIMSTSIDFTTGKRGKENVIADGFRYSLDKRRTTATGVVNSYWRCVTPGLDSATQEEVWPSALVRGCYFLYKQAFWRNF